MRRGIATVFIVGLVGLGAAACGADGDVAGSVSTSDPGSVVAGDKSVATATACKEAIAASEARQQELADALDDLRAGDESGAAPAGKAVDDIMKRYAYQLSLLSGQDIDSAVKAAITDAAGTVTALAKTPLERSMPTLEGIPTTLKNACV